MPSQGLVTQLVHSLYNEISKLLKRDIVEIIRRIFLLWWSVTLKYFFPPPYVKQHNRAIEKERKYCSRIAFEIRQMTQFTNVTITFIIMCICRRR